jgi:hypothetical protein
LAAAAFEFEKHTVSKQRRRRENLRDGVIMTVLVAMGSTLHLIAVS